MTWEYTYNSRCGDGAPAAGVAFVDEVYFVPTGASPTVQIESRSLLAGGQEMERMHGRNGLGELGEGGMGWARSKEVGWELFVRSF